LEEVAVTRKIVVWTSGILLLVAGLLVFFATQSDPADLWVPCIGKQPSECQVPAGFHPIARPCPDYIDCTVGEGKTAYGFSVRMNSSTPIWSSSQFAVIAVDRTGKIVKVYIRRRYASL